MRYMYMTEEEPELQYYQFPKFLLELNLSHNARIIYMLLYDRGRLSRKNHWVDEQGHVYSVFPIAELAKKFGRCQSSVKAALKELDDAGLLIRKVWGVSKPKHLYIRIPEMENSNQKDENTAVGKTASREMEMKLPYSRKYGLPEVGKSAPSKVKEQYKKNKNYRIKAGETGWMPDYTCEEGESL